jgi:IMP dehydrogenase
MKCEPEFIGKSFNDFLFRPQYGRVYSRSEIDLTSKLTKRLNFDIPVISSNMDSITENQMANEITELGGFGFIHRASTIEKQVEEVNKINFHFIRGAAIGVSGDFLERAEALIDAGVKIILVDIAHGHSVMMKNALKMLIEEFQHDYVQIIAGNVATYDGARFLADQGVCGIKVGIGTGSVCTTRLETGVGVPQMQALRESWRGIAEGGYNIPIIACGGIRTDKDIFFALAAGASSVMLGRMLAGTNEAAMKDVYRGMASEEVQKLTGTYKGASEGMAVTIETSIKTVPKDHSVKNVVDRISGHLRSSLSYAGVTSVKELHEKVTPNLMNYLIPLTPQTSHDSFAR